GTTVWYEVEDSQVAKVDPAGAVTAVANGATFVVLSAGGQVSRLPLRVTQRATHVRLSRESVLFDALGDTVSIDAVALDSLESPVPATVSSASLEDTAVAVLVNSTTLRARGNGTTTLRVTVAGVSAEATVSVNQVPTRVTASLSSPDSLVELPIGFIVPMVCEARD